MRQFKFFRTQTQEWEQVLEETWQWVAYYEDGTVLKQFGDDGIFHQFAEIDQDKLAIFKMVSPFHPQEYTILFSDPNMKLIHFYRNTVLNMLTDTEKKIRLYCFGYEKKIGPASRRPPGREAGGEQKVQKVIMMITPNNELIVTEDPELVKVE